MSSPLNSVQAAGFSASAVLSRALSRAAWTLAPFVVLVLAWQLAIGLSSAMSRIVPANWTTHPNNPMARQAAE